MVLKASITEDKKRETLANLIMETEILKAAPLSDLVVEAASENFIIKEKIFRQLDEICPASTILASNTSSISITKIGACTKRPEKVIGMHFMNPVPIMKLVEIIRGYATDNLTTKTIMDLSIQLGKIPVEVNDYPGFVANRILMPMINESIFTLFEGVAGVYGDEIGNGTSNGPFTIGRFYWIGCVPRHFKCTARRDGSTKICPLPIIGKYGYSRFFGRQNR